MKLGAVCTAKSTTRTGEKNTSRGKTQGIIGKTKDHFEHGKAEQESRGTASSVPLVQYLLARDRHGEDRESNAKRLEKKMKLDAADQHYQRALLLTVWRAISSVTEKAHLQKVKAERHHQYCVMHRIWTNLIHNMTSLRAYKTEQVRRWC